MASFHKLPQLMNGIDHHDLAREWIHAWNAPSLDLILIHTLRTSSLPPSCPA